MAQDAEAVDQEAPPPFVWVVILPMHGECLMVNGHDYCEQDKERVDLPDEGPFQITVGESTYELDTESPEGGPLNQVFVVAGQVTLGVYRDLGVLAAVRVCECIECENGQIVCGCGPRCPPMGLKSNE